MLDVLFFEAGTINHETGRYTKESWSVYGDLPSHLPAAREYWAVFRSSIRECLIYR